MASANPIYIDLNQLFGLNTFPQLLNDEDAIRGSIYNIITTPIGSRAFVPEYGSRLYQFVQEPCDDITSSLLETFLIQAIEKWEPRVQILRDKTKVTPLSNGFNINLVYAILPSRKVSSFESVVSK